MCHFANSTFNKSRFGSKFFRKRTEKMKKELEDAASETTRRSSSPVCINPDRHDITEFCGTSVVAGGFFSDELPTKVQKKFVSIDVFVIILFRQIVYYFRGFHFVCLRSISEELFFLIKRN